MLVEITAYSPAKFEDHQHSEMELPVCCIIYNLKISTPRFVRRTSDCEYVAVFIYLNTDRLKTTGECGIF
jgi:hypothetical protein